MGRRDFRKHEPKKAKKGAKKPSSVTIFASSGAVEVVKKKRKVHEEGGEGEG